MRRYNPLGIGTSIFALSIVAVAPSACSDEQEAGIDGIKQPLEVRCIDDSSTLPETSWICPDDLTIECNDPEGTAVASINSEPPEGAQCSNVVLSVHPEGPFAIGTHQIEISSTADGGMLLCEATLTVVDTAAPQLTPKHVELWPPNHKWRSISAADCFEIHDACDADVEATLLWATSDEAIDSTGDGNTEPDVQFLGCDRVQLRAERQGSGDGRVYSLGWRFDDDAGNRVERICQVIVPHDQGHASDTDADADADAVVELHNDTACHRASPGSQADQPPAAD